MSILSQLQPDQSQFIQSDIVPKMTSKADLINLDKLKNFKIDVTPTTPTQLTISDQKKAELKKLAEKDQGRRNRRAYWHISKEEMSEATPNLLQTGMDSIPGLAAGILDNDYSNALAAFSSASSTVNPTIDVVGDTKKMVQQQYAMSLDKQAVPEQGVKPGEPRFAKQGIKIEYMNLFK